MPTASIAEFETKKDDRPRQGERQPCGEDYRNPNFQTCTIWLSSHQHVSPAQELMTPLTSHCPVSSAVEQAPQCGCYLHSYDFSPQTRIPTTAPPCRLISALAPDLPLRVCIETSHCGFQWPAFFSPSQFYSFSHDSLPTTCTWNFPC